MTAWIFLFIHQHLLAWVILILAVHELPSFLSEILMCKCLISGCQWHWLNTKLFKHGILILTFSLPVIWSLTVSARAVIFSFWLPVWSKISRSTIPIWQLWDSGSYLRAEHWSALLRQWYKHWSWELKLYLWILIFLCNSWSIISYGFVTSGNSDDVTNASEGAEMWSNLVTFGALAITQSKMKINQKNFILALFAFCYWLFDCSVNQKGASN